MKKSESYLSVIPQHHPHSGATIYGNKTGLWKLCWSLFKYLVFSNRKYESFGPFYNTDGEGFELEMSTSISSTNPHYTDYEVEKEIAARENCYKQEVEKLEKQREELRRNQELNELMKDVFGKDYE